MIYGEIHTSFIFALRTAFACDFYISVLLSDHILSNIQHEKTRKFKTLWGY